MSLALYLLALIGFTILLSTHIEVSMYVPRSAAEVIDQDFLGFRAKLIELAATLDRIDRAEGDPSEDPRTEQLRRAIDLLSSRKPDRAERMQLHFSLGYDPKWQDEFSKR